MRQTARATMDPSAQGIVRRLSAACLLLSCCLAGPLAIATEEADPPLVEVAGETYRVSDLRAFVGKRPALSVMLMSRSGIRDLVGEFVDSKIFRLEGERLGYAPPGDVKLGEDGYYFMVQSRLLPRCATPPDEELEAFYDRDPSRFAAPPLVRVSRALLAEGEVIDGLSAQAYLERQRAALAQDPGAFAALIAAIEADRARDGHGGPKVGDLGFLPLPPPDDRTEPLEQSLAEAAAGTLIGPFAHDGYLFLLLVTDRRDPPPTPWPQAKKDVERAMREDCRAQALAATRAELFERYQVRVHEEVVSAIQPIAAPAPQ